MKFVYLYRITLTKDDITLYYYGIRICKCDPKDDPYMGSPETHRKIWQDSSYVKKKEILKIGSYDEEYENFVDQEVTLIKESWNIHGLYNHGGFSLNVSAGKAIHPTAISGEKSCMKKEEVKRKVIETKLKKYGPSLISAAGLEKRKIANRRPERIQKILETKRIRDLEDPSRKIKHAEAVRKAVGGENSPNKRPERRKQVADSQREKIANGTWHLSDPEIKKKAGRTMSEVYWKDPENRKKRSVACKRQFLNNPEKRKIVSDRVKEWYKNNPEAARQKNLKSAETQRKNKLKKQAITLESFFES